MRLLGIAILYVLGGAVAIFIVASLLYHPNRVRAWFGPDAPPGTESDHKVFQNRLITTADEIDKGIRAALRERRSLEGEEAEMILAVWRLRGKPGVTRRQIEESGLPGLLETVKSEPSAVTIAEFESRAREIRTVLERLTRGEDLVGQQDFLDKTQRNLDDICKSNAERRTAVNEIRQIFKGSR